MSDYNSTSGNSSGSNYETTTSSSQGFCCKRGCYGCEEGERIRAQWDRVQKFY